MINIDDLRGRFPGWTVREVPPSATRHRQLTDTEMAGGMHMTIWAGSLTELAAQLDQQEALAAQLDGEEGLVR